LDSCVEKSCEVNLPAITNDKKVAAYFDSKAVVWHAMYSQARKDVWGDIHQTRLARFLSLADKLRLPQGTKALDVGCGAGHAAVALANRSYIVQATDVAQNMIDLAQKNADSAGLADRVQIALGDIYNLNFPSHAFGLVLSIGVIPWLSSPGPAIQELGRVLKPGGYLFCTADNRWRLAHLLDPAISPAFGPAKKLFKTISSRPNHSAPEPSTVTSHLHSLRELDAFFAHAGLERVHFETLGFGPFTLLRRKVLPDRLGVAVNRALQSLTDMRVPMFRLTGAQFLILARKRG
jgi:ubiquinone/menaquinone biosynthesis C-methylase UbiE